MKRWLLLAALALGACDGPQDALRIGGKDFGESSILSEMIAALAEEAEIPVVRRLSLGDTQMNLEALKRGDIDIYAEYNGTGLVMLGQPALADGDAAMERVRALYQPLELTWGERFGFANNYGLAMREMRAEELGIASISDLVGPAGDLAIGMDENFAGRPLDGFQPLTARYGMRFGEVEVIETAARATLYGMLLDEAVDVGEVFTTDGQIAELGLRVLRDDLGFFPVYEAAPLMRSDALARFPRLAEALAPLAGAFDAAAMRRLNAQVDQDALSPRDVARAALAEIELIEPGDDLEISAPLVLAAAGVGAADGEGGKALRAVRTAFPGRRVTIEETLDPLAAVGRGDARLALVSAVDFEAVSADGSLGDRPFEGVGVVGQSYLHLIGLNPGVRRLADVSVIATGPEGSATHRAGLMLASGLDGIEIAPGAAADPAAAGASGAQAALLLAPLGSAVAIEALAAEGASRLIALDGWGTGNNLVRFPALRQARIPAGTYPGQSAAVETLAAQLVLAGPVIADDADAVGPQGPGATAPTPVAALSDETVLALVEALDAEIGLDPALPQAAVLMPSLPDGPGAVNPSRAISALSVAVMVLFGWLVWLYSRPVRR